LESAVGALWASTSDEAREVVAEESYKILRRNHKRREYLELPIAMLARFYEDAARNITDPSGIIRAQFYADAAQEHARDGNEERELEMLLKQVVLGLMQSDLSEAHDILASRYVSALKHTGLSVAAKWTVLFSETLRTEANNLYKSTQILMDFLERHPVELAQTPPTSMVSARSPSSWEIVMPSPTTRIVHASATTLPTTSSPPPEMTTPWHPWPRRPSGESSPHAKLRTCCSLTSI
ncbi:TPA: hypothetical protein I8V99_001073, partial [Corynebacterium striatum]|nr:hypothetical protein [Corynebacterium striatum]